MPKPSDAFHPSATECDFISAIRLLMICGLVWHHLFEIPGSTQSPRLNMAASTHFIPELFNGFLHMAMMAAVPVLSIISGFLFFRKPSVRFGAQLRRRALTVALPAWLWAGLWLGLAFVMYASGAAAALPGWTGYGLDDPSAMTVLNGVVGITAQPYAFQFWFVHDLILTLLLSPVIYFLLRRLGGWLLLPMLAAWLAIPWPPVFFSGNVPMFFTVGAWLALSQGLGLDPVLERMKHYLWLLLPVFAAALLVRLFSHHFGPLEDLIGGHIYLCLLRIIGVMAMASLVFRLTSSGRARALVRHSGYAFFLFAAHYPLIELFKAAARQVPGHATSPGLLLSWLLIPPLTILTVALAARGLERLSPGLFLLLNGGRGTGGEGRVATPPLRPGAAGPQGGRWAQSKG